MSDSKQTKRLIEVDFPLQQTSLDSVHEKNVRHGHLSTLHIWPARRPLAASRAVILATLLPDPEDEEKRHELIRRIGGVVKKVIKKEAKDGKTVQRIKEETEGSLTRWLGTPPKTGKKAIAAHKTLTDHREAELEAFREEIRNVYGGRAPRVLDPFSGGGAIPLEAMRLGCETTAMDINPVACFVLRGTLEYPQKLAGKTYPLPQFAVNDTAFMQEFYAANPQAADDSTKYKQTKAKGGIQGNLLEEDKNSHQVPHADLAWQVRAWGRHVLDEARKELGKFYPTYAEFEPWKWQDAYSFERQPMRLVPLTEDGVPDIAALNGDFSEDYIKDTANARWVEKPTVAYLWARTARCASCRAEIPLLKTKWLCKKAGKRVLLTLTPKGDNSGVTFGIQENVPVVGGNNKQRTAHDKSIGKGCMSRGGVTCPCCGSTMTMDDLRHEGKAGRLGMMPTAVVYEQTNVDGKRYRLPTEKELECANAAAAELDRVYADIPFGIPTEPTPDENALGMRIPKYGFSRWCDIFTPRQLLALGVFCREVRAAMTECQKLGYPQEWAEAIGAYLAITFDKLIDYNSAICTWHNSCEKIGHTFARFALPMAWDITELAAINNVGGSFLAHLEWVALFAEETARGLTKSTTPIIFNQSCIQPLPENLDCIVTDPPYYDAIPYSDCMDFFYVWLRRTTFGTILDNGFFANPLAPKWDKDAQDGELIDDASRHDGNKGASKQAYEDGMAEVFKRCHTALTPEGRLVIVFANKTPDAWETMVSAIIRAGFVVTASWPIQTEMTNRIRGIGSAALSSSVWLVCKKRGFARPGWDTAVLENMRKNIKNQLYAFWDSGVRGPDFVWAATGPALSAYSAYPVVKKADSGGIMSVSEFLAHVRRIVVDFVVGRVLQSNDTATEQNESLDSVTSYYLLHRNDFAMDDAPAGACILYATACGLSDRELDAVWNLIKMGKATSADDDIADEEDDDSDDSESGDSGGKFRLRKWTERTQSTMGIEPRNGRPVPIIDRVHRLMHLWKAGEVNKVDEFLDAFALRRNELFLHLVQSLIELSENEERSILESISNHIQARGAQPTRMEQISLGK